METTFTAKEINIMTITIGLRADKVSKEGNFVAERNYYGGYPSDISKQQIRGTVV